MGVGVVEGVEKEAKTTRGEMKGVGRCRLKKLKQMPKRN
jgi:hypothetical protein